MNSNLRPDEGVTQGNIQRSRERSRELQSGLKNVATLGGAGIAAGGLAKIAPFLSEYISEDMALKGISKVMPTVGKFLKSGITQGLTLGSGLEFLKENISKPAPSQKNIIQKYSPELFQEISDLIQKGNAPIQAGANAHKKHKKVIQQIEKDYQTDWLELVESIFGKGDIAQQGMQGQQQQAAPQAQQQMGQPQQQMQGGSGNARLLQMLQGINQRLGGQ